MASAWGNSWGTAWGNSWGATSAPVEATNVLSSGVGRRRHFAQIGDRVVEVSGYAEAEKLFREARREEKKQEVEKKRLSILVKKISIDLTTKPPAKIERLEKRIDHRAERIAALYALILEKLEARNNDEEEEWLMLH